MWPGHAVSLRPLGVGERIDAAIKIVRAYFLALPGFQWVTQVKG
jgi:hypothetical protein